MNIREILAEEFDRAGASSVAHDIRSGCTDSNIVAGALRAMRRVLNEATTPLGDEHDAPEQVKKPVTFGDELKIIREMFTRCVKHDPRLESATSRVQRCLQCGYNHAAMIMDRLERDKFISEPDINGRRKLL